MLVVPVDDISYGGDSLAAVEIRNWVARNLDTTIRVMEILSGRSLEALAGGIRERSTVLKGKAKGEIEGEVEG